MKNTLTAIWQTLKAFYMVLVFPGLLLFGLYTWVQELNGRLK